MECFNHAGTPAVCTCAECNKSLCKICAVDFGNTILCPNCFADYISFQETHLKKLKTRIIVGLVLAAFFILPGITGIRSLSGFIALFLMFLWVASYPVSLYLTSGTPDPYVPTNFSAAGNLMLFRWFTAFLIGPWSLFNAYRGYHMTKSVLEENKSLLADIVKVGDL